MVELAFEGHRYYDARRWMIAQQEFPDRNILLIYWPLHTKILGRGHQMFGKVVLGYLSLSHYFFPINQEQLSEMKNITQNYGW